jgi:hypothetical protein
MDRLEEQRQQMIDRHVRTLMKDWHPSLGQARFIAVQRRASAQREREIWDAVVADFDKRIADAQEKNNG